MLIDPHTAVGVAAGQADARDPDEIMICLSTAHPAKFPDAIAEATGKTAEIPQQLVGLEERAERCETLANDLTKVKEHIGQNTRSRG